MKIINDILTANHNEIKNILMKLYDTGELEKILPELVALKGVDIINGQKHKDNFYHTIQVVENTYKVTNKPYLRLAAILHDIGKAPTKKYVENSGWTFHNHEYIGSKMVNEIFERLDLDFNQLEYVKCIVSEHGRMKELTESKEVNDSAIRRFGNLVGEYLEDLTLFCKCDMTTKFEDKKIRMQTALDNVYQRVINVRIEDENAKWRSPINGQMIMNEFGIGPSIELGIIKMDIENAIKSGEIEDNYEAAYEYMLSIKSKYL